MGKTIYEKADSNPCSIRLGELKKFYEKKASDAQRSLHWIILKVLKENKEREESELAGK